MHLAEVNIAKLLYPKGDPRVQAFFDGLDRVNALAERMPGFVWRLKDETGNATNVRFTDDPLVIANVSVWESVEALQAYVFQTVHTTFYRKRPDWFEPMSSPHFAMWWVERGTRPDFADAKAKLEELATRGPSDNVFTWAETSAAQEWRAKRCA